MSMTSSSRGTVSPAQNFAFRPDRTAVVTALAIAVGIALRATTNVDAPLWFDESFTGAIASQPSLADVLHQSLIELNAPLYHFVAYAGARIFGVSDAGLRAPALIFGLLAPLLCLVPTAGIARRTKLLWCAATALWFPGAYFAQEARCYTLLQCLSILSTIAFVKLIDEPTTKRALLWISAGSAAILTHYFAVFLIGFQGLMYLAAHRRRALETWPAAIAFAPVALWLFFVLPRLSSFSNAVWYPLTDMQRFVYLINFVVGNILFVPFLMLAAVMATVAEALRRRTRQLVEITDFEQTVSSAGVRFSVLAAVVGLATVLALSSFRPMLEARYLMPFAPGILLGCAVVFEKWPRFWFLSFLAPIVFSGLGAFDVRTRPVKDYYGFEAASDEVMAAGAKHLVFLWDHPAHVAAEPKQLAIVAGFDFKRRGYDIDVTSLKLAPGDDPNERLLAAATQPHTAILWIYDTWVRGTAAAAHPPIIPSLDPAWRCHDVGKDETGKRAFGVLVCVTAGRG
jgi:hypothetical protein